MLIATGYPHLWHFLVYIDKWVSGLYSDAFNFHIQKTGPIFLDFNVRSQCT